MPRRNRNADYRFRKPDWAGFDGSIFPFVENKLEEVRGTSKLKVTGESIVREFRESSDNDVGETDFRKFIGLIISITVGGCMLILGLMYFFMR